MNLDNFEFVFDEIRDELIAWTITLEWFYPNGIETAVKRMFDLGLIFKEREKS